MSGREGGAYLPPVPYARLQLRGREGGEWLQIASLADFLRAMFRHDNVSECATWVVPPAFSTLWQFHDVIRAAEFKPSP